MNFLKPTSLYLLFLIPLLLLLYVLKLRRRTYVVSSCLLWEQAIEDMKANTPFQRLRKNLLLPLQIMFLTLIILAAARPFWRGAVSAAQNTILIIDASASMKATDAGETRFEAAKSAAAKVVDNLDSEDRIMIIKAASSPKIVSGFVSDKLQLHEALDKMRPVDTSTNLINAIQLAASIAKDAQNSEILLFSDGAAKLPAASELADARMRFVGFGKKDADNVGITALEIGQSLTDASERQVFTALQNFGQVEKRSVLLELYHNENLIDVRELNLSPGERRSVVFDGLSGYAEGVIKAVIDADDDLDVDDHAYYVLSSQDTFRVLLVSAGNRFLEGAIGTGFAKAQFSRETPKTYSTNDKYDLVVFDGFVPEDLPGGNMMFVNPKTDLPFAKLISCNGNPAVIDWDRSHPVMRFVDISNLRIDEMCDYETPPWAAPLVESDMGTLAWLGEHDGRRIIVLPFEVRPGASSNFPMLTAFPIFMANALNWLAGVNEESSRRQVSPGEPLRLSPPGDAVDQLLTVRKPDGTESQFRWEGGKIAFKDTDMVGIYEIIGEKFTEKFAVNLLDESESHIEPVDKIEIAGQEIASSSISAVSNREIWSRLVLVALMLLALEWWVYHRRVLV